MQYIQYLFFRLLVLLLAWLPPFLLYRLADFCSWFLYSVFKYRLETVRQNILLAFPQKTAAERRTIEQAFYHNLGDIFVEGVWGFSLSVDEMVKRYKAINPDILTPYFEQGKSVIVAGSHYVNWEWGATCAAPQVAHRPIGLYKVLNNTRIDQLLRQSRAKFDMTLASIVDTAHIFESEHDQCKAFVMLSDQRPFKKRNAYWMEFLGQETACLMGVERYAKQYDLPVFYVSQKRIKRGHYTFELIPLEMSPRQSEEGAITRKFMGQLEQIILEEPSGWLWSHKRWK